MTELLLSKGTIGPLLPTRTNREKNRVSLTTSCRVKLLKTFTIKKNGKRHN
jgi:hypothetical protein